MKKIEAVILGGGGVEEWFAHENVKNKGMLVIGGKPMISYTISALKNIDEIEKVTLIGDNYSQEITDQVDVTLPDNGSLPANIDQAFENAESEYVLMMTSDVPLISSETISGILKDMDWESFDLSLPIVTKEETMKRFPGTKRTFAKLKEGKVKVGNLYILKKEAYAKIQPIVKETARRRKSVIKQALQFGIGFLFRLIVFKNISIPELKKRVTKVLGISVDAPILAYPEVGIDVDKIEDLVFCRKHLERH